MELIMNVLSLCALTMIQGWKSFAILLQELPGANDNASGVSAILEIARILHKQKLYCSLQFVFFSGEEQGLLGSKHYAKFLKEIMSPNIDS